MEGLLGFHEMTDTARRRLPPMTAIEFAIAAAFRNFFFALGLALVWLVLLAPLMALAWYLGLRTYPPDLPALGPSAQAALAALAVGGLLALLSVSVSWQRRLLLGERPMGWRWWRLDGVVWRFAAGLALMLIVLGLYAAAAYAVAIHGPPLLPPQLSQYGEPLVIAVQALLGLSALFSFCRLSVWLAGLAAGDRDFTLRAAWKLSRGNRLRYLGFTFWLLFTLAISAGAGAGAFYAQQMMPDPWMKAAAFAVIAVFALLALLLLASVAAALYRGVMKEAGQDGG
jgi:hypothetical protein